jgi:hypothetical protein
VKTPVAYVVLRWRRRERHSHRLMAWYNARAVNQRLAALRFSSTSCRAALAKVLKRELRDQFELQA